MKLRAEIRDFPFFTEKKRRRAESSLFLFYLKSTFFTVLAKMASSIVNIAERSLQQIKYLLHRSMAVGKRFLSWRLSHS